jgi:hypothetical protein
MLAIILNKIFPVGPFIRERLFLELAVGCRDCLPVSITNGEAGHVIIDICGTAPVIDKTSWKR